MQHSATRPTRPKMPTAADEARAQHQSVRADILCDDYDETLRLWLEEHVDPERLEVWGIPDTSANPLADLSRQLSIPGLYGVRPRWRHPNGAQNEALIGPDGWLDSSRYHTLMQWVQFMTLGMGDYLVRMDADDMGRLTVRPVAPHDVYVRCRQDSPGVAAELWELICRYHEAAERWVYCWDVFDLGDLRSGRPPSYRIHAADTAGGLADDMSPVFLARPDGAMGEVAGDEYPWRTADGIPRLPYVVYHASDTGKFWNHHDKRGVHRGTLNTALYHTYAGHCARDATGSMVLVAGLDPVSVDVHAPDRSIVASKSRSIRTVKTTPGALIYHHLEEGAQPFVSEIGPGANLESVWGFAVAYEQRQAIRWGLNPADAERQAANPMSGVSMFLSRQEKREFSRQVEPLFRRADLDAVELAAIVLRAAAAGDFDERGYTITYAEIPHSPQEERERRERLQWEVDQGLISRAELFQRLNPGSSGDDAVRAIVDAAGVNARIDAAIAAESAMVVAAGNSDAPASDSALNGAQVASAVAIVASVGTAISRDSAIAMLQTFFRLTPSEAEEIVGDGPPAPIKAPAPAPEPETEPADEE